MKFTPAAISFVIAAAIWLSAGAARAQDADAVARGQYIATAAGCASCHTDVKNMGAAYAGGREIKTPYGSFFGPNITPDTVNGIGAWSEADFRRALREGRGRGGEHLFPAFPFTTFTKMTDSDIRDLWAYLRSVPPSNQASKPHQIRFPYNIRFVQMFWKWLNFDSSPFRPDPEKSAQVNRGAYIVEALAHCGECHTPRNLMGGLNRALFLAGTKDGTEGGSVPNITPDQDTGIGKWTDDELGDVLALGLTPDGDSVGGLMAEVVDANTGKLNPDDIGAIVAYLRTVPPVRNAVRSPRK